MGSNQEETVVGWVVAGWQSFSSATSVDNWLRRFASRTEVLENFSGGGEGNEELEWGK